MKYFIEAFTMDTIIQVAFGVKLDSFNNPDNPIITNGRKVFQMNLGFWGVIQFLVIIFAPKLAKWLNIEIAKEETEFFRKMATKIMDQKRAEFDKAKSYAKANSFIEFMLEAEEEGRRLSVSNETNELPENRPIKCKSQ